MNAFYVIIRRGKTSFVLEGPYSTKQRARLGKDRYFFTDHDHHCDTCESKHTFTSSHHCPISTCRIENLPNWDKGSSYGIDNEFPIIESGTLFNV